MKAIICDHCNKIGAKTYKAFISREPDPSGNGYEVFYDYIDLCHTCINLKQYKDFKKGGIVK